MEFIVENLSLILFTVAIIALFIAAIIAFIRSGRETMIENLKEWLVYATSLAEKELGSGTGVLKLRYVYDMFLAKFPWLAKFISFEHFSDMVDNALTEMKNLLETNESINDYVTK